jgi:ornithine cyclodeaminase/alanine dehydrogenase-like protein (mu-crystallin family)
MSNGVAPPLGSLRYLSEQDIRDSIPSVAEGIGLAESALRAVAEGTAEMPLKIGVHPRPDSLLHAMPAWYVADDVTGVKWVSTYPSNGKLGIRTVDALIILNRADTGQAIGLLEAGYLTAVRTAAVSGAAIARFAPAVVSRVAVIGAGLQGNRHVEVLASLFVGAELRTYDRHPERAAALAERAVEWGMARASSAASAAEAVERAEVIVSAAALGSDAVRIDPAELAADALVVAVDTDTYVSAQMVRTATAFIVDDRPRFLAYLADGEFPGYPEPLTTLGEAIVNGRRAESGLTVVSTVGMGVVDVVFASAVLRRAEVLQLGVSLDRDGSARA